VSLLGPDVAFFEAKYEFRCFVFRVLPLKAHLDLIVYLFWAIIWPECSTDLVYR